MSDKILYRISMLRNLIPYTKGVKRFFALSLLVSIISAVLSFVNSIFYKMFIEQVILQSNTSKIIIVIIGYISIFAINTIIGYIKNYSNNKMVNTTTFRTKNKIWQSLFKKDFTSYETMDIGDIKMRIDDDIQCINDYAGTQTIDYTISYITMIVSIILLLYIQWLLAIFAIAAIPITFIINHYLSKKEAILNDGNRINDQNISSWLNTSIQGWREVRALNLEKHERNKLFGFLKNYAKYFVEWNFYWITRDLVLPMIKDTLIMQFALYFIGGLLIMADKLSIGSLLVFGIYYNMLSSALNDVSGKDADLQSNRFASDRFMDELGKARITQKRKGLKPNNSNTIVFDNVCFSYPNSIDEVVTNLNLKINKGERVAIIGKSGCGKTTILKLMTGMIEPTKGKIVFADTDLCDIDLSELHKRIGFVMQENMLFNTSLKENLLYGKNNATDNDLITACKKAYIFDFIDNLPNKFDTVIGEKGIKLSGGQRQRIVLARLFLRDVEIFIFDEATSALDQYSESIVHDAIKGIDKDKTIIVVAHRASSISLCDRKIVLDAQV